LEKSIALPACVRRQQSMCDTRQTSANSVGCEGAGESGWEADYVPWLKRSL
jgi:hypothetical protein